MFPGGDHDRRKTTTIFIVCESKSCNPRIYEYDAVCERFAVYGDNKEYLVEMRRELKHTAHTTTDRFEQFDTHRGWCKSYRCVECGNVRKF